ncbi:MAG: hypothetical protein MR006_07230 [Arcanobacterium sp.]|nr:hypothetical protein [Arcanobacterium sp.]
MMQKDPQNNMEERTTFKAEHPALKSASNAVFDVAPISQRQALENLKWRTRTDIWVCAGLAAFLAILGIVQVTQFFIDPSSRGDLVEVGSAYLFGALALAVMFALFREAVRTGKPFPHQ